MRLIMALGLVTALATSSLAQMPVIKPLSTVAMPKADLKHTAPIPVMQFSSTPIAYIYINNVFVPVYAYIPAQLAPELCSYTLPDQKPAPKPVPKPKYRPIERTYGTTIDDTTTGNNSTSGSLGSLR